MEKINKRLYDMTADNKVYKLCHYHQEGICCLRCAKRGRRGYFYYDYNHGKHRYPSWKLVSKNKKQWIPKDLKIEEENSTLWRNRGDITW